MSSLRRELAQCRKELADAEIAIQDHDEELAVLDRDAEKLQSQMTLAKSREWIAKAQLEESESVRKGLEQQRQALQDELDQTKHSLSDARDVAVARLAVSARHCIFIIIETHSVTTGLQYREGVCMKNSVQ